MNIENENENDNECQICFERNKCSNFKCDSCKNSVCIECFKRVSIVGVDDETYISLNKFNCPYCRYEKRYDYDYFNKEEIINLTQKANKVIFDMYINPIKESVRETFIKTYTRSLEEKYEPIEKENKELKKIIEKMNNDKIKQENLINNLKLLHNSTKNKRIDKKLLKEIIEC